MTPGDHDAEAITDPVPGGDETACRVAVSGRVQGVFFRASTRHQARRRDLVGWVRNTTDGQVEAHLQGGQASVNEVLDWMRGGGPSAARVERVEVEPTDPIEAGEFDVVG